MFFILEVIKTSVQFRCLDETTCIGTICIKTTLYRNNRFLGQCTATQPRVHKQEKDINTLPSLASDFK